MPSTSKGFPYPSSSDDADVPGDLNALASAVDLKLNDYALVTQGVRRYATAAARATAIPSPTAGMTTYLDDTGSESPSSTIPQLEIYNGSAWQTPYASTLLAQASFSATSTFSISNVFTSAYRNYRIVIDNANIASAQGFYLRFRQNTTDYITANYQNQFFQASGTTILGNRSGAISYCDFGLLATGSDRSVCQVDLFNPQAVAYTHAVATTFAVVGGSGPRIDTSYNWVYNAQVFDGFTLLSAGGANISGNVTVYGVRTA